MKRIRFFYPSKITGGAEYLFKTAAEFLDKNNDVAVLDYSDGWLYQNVLIENKVPLTKGRLEFLDEDVVLVVTSNLVRKLDFFFYGDFKVISWTLQSYNIIPSFPKIGPLQYRAPLLRQFLKHTLLRNEYVRVSRLVSYLNENNSLYVMDGQCNEVMKNYIGLQAKGFLPVVISNGKFSGGYNEAEKSSEIHALWLGRLDGEFKNEILKKVLMDIDAYALDSGQRVKFSIVGSGPGYKDIFDLSKTLKSIKIDFHLEKRGKELKAIISSSNIGFAMGTSAIEISACKVPTILLDPSYAPVHSDYRYQWFFNSTDYILGRFLDDADDKSMGNELSMKKVMEDLMRDGKELSCKSYCYAMNNHSEPVLEEKMMWAVKNTSASFTEMKALGLFKKPIWWKIKRWIA